MVVEQSPFARAHLRGSLEMAGYRVIEASGFQDAVDKLAREKVRIIAASPDLIELAQHVKRNPKLAHTFVCWACRFSEAGRRSAQSESALFEDYQMKFDRKAMLSSLERLAEAVEQK